MYFIKLYVRYLHLAIKIELCFELDLVLSLGNSGTALRIKVL